MANDNVDTPTNRRGKAAKKIVDSIDDLKEAMENDDFAKVREIMGYEPGDLGGIVRANLMQKSLEYEGIIFPRRSITEKEHLEDAAILDALWQVTSVHPSDFDESPPGYVTIWGDKHSTDLISIGLNAQVHAKDALRAGFSLADAYKYTVHQINGYQGPFDRGERPLFSLQTSATTEATGTGEIVYGRGLYDLEGPEATLDVWRYGTVHTEGFLSARDGNFTVAGESEFDVSIINPSVEKRGQEKRGHNTYFASIRRGFHSVARSEREVL